MFAKIDHLDDLLPHIKDKDEIKVNYHSDHTIVCYIISNEHTFNNPYALECRGITFDKQGQIIARPLHKFFNLGETQRTLEQNINFKDIVRVMDKIDGSMIHPAIINGKLDFKTKKSFVSDVALLAKDFIYNKRPNVVGFCNELCSLGYTPIFEFVHPLAQIVIDYKEPNITLLQVRKNNTGEYLFNTGWLLDLIIKYNIPTVKIETDPISKLLSERESKTDIEGYIFQFSNGDMFKAKTEWYYNLHHAITDLRERDIVEMFFNDKLDDLKAFLSDKDVDMSLITNIEDKCIQEFNAYKKETEQIVENETKNNLTAKEMAFKYKEHPYFTVIMSKFRSTDDEKMEKVFKDYFLKQNLKKYPLTNVYTFGINQQQEIKKLKM